MPAESMPRTNIFAGSRFPGSVSYSYAYNAEGNYAIPGIADFVTHGNSQNFGINWSDNIPDKPSFTRRIPKGHQRLFRVRHQ